MASTYLKNKSRFVVARNFDSGRVEKEEIRTLDRRCPLDPSNHHRGAEIFIDTGPPFDGQKVFTRKVSGP